MPETIVAGGGLAGLACRRRTLLRRPFRESVPRLAPSSAADATSYEIDGETIDNCQHILLRCCVQFDGCLL